MKPVIFGFRNENTEFRDDWQEARNAQLGRLLDEHVASAALAHRASQQRIIFMEEAPLTTITEKTTTKVKWSAQCWGRRRRV